MTQIFLLGATGYIGGEVLYQLSQNRQNVAISCLVRDESKAATVKKAYPNVKIVIGSLDDAGLLKEQVEKSDIVLSLAATKHAASVLAIADGFEARKAKTSKPAYWVQISGATIYASDEIKNSRYGYASDAVFDDLKDRDEIITTINSIPSRISEQTVIRRRSDVVKTALIVGPHIYGVGRGPGNTRTVQGPEIARATFKLRHGVKINDGLSIWSDVHVADISSMICLLVQAALDGRDDGIWNEDGVYNPENGKMTFGELGSLVAKEGLRLGLIESDSVKSIKPEEADALSDHASILWGTNAIIVSTRAREKLGWKPTGPSLAEEVPGMVEQEATALGLV